MTALYHRSCSQDLHNPVEWLHTAVCVDVMFDRNAANIHVVSRIEVAGPNESVDGYISIQLSVVFFAMDSFSTKSESPKLRKAEKGE